MRQKFPRVDDHYVGTRMNYRFHARRSLYYFRAAHCRAAVWMQRVSIGMIGKTENYE